MRDGIARHLETDWVVAHDAWSLTGRDDSDITPKAASKQVKLDELFIMITNEEMLGAFKKFPRHIFLDATHKTNNYNFKMLQIASDYNQYNIMYIVCGRMV